MKVVGMRGRLPETWKWAECSEVIDVRDGTHDTPKYVSNGYPQVTSKNLKPEGIDFSTVSYISEADHIEICKRSKVHKGDILFAMIGTIGNPVLVDIDTDFSIKNIALFKFSESPIDPKYFKYLLESPIVNRQLELGTRGGTQKFVSLKVLRSMMVPFPPIAEQRRIAAILDKADAIHRKRKQAIQHTEELLRATFLDMFGDPVTNPKGWEMRTVGECLRSGVLVEIQDGNHGEIHPKVSDFVKSGIPFVAANALTGNRLNLLDCPCITLEQAKRLRVGFARGNDVLLSHKGTVGLTDVVPPEVEVLVLTPQTTYYRVNIDNLLPEYLSAYFKTSFFQKNLAQFSKQSTRAYIGITRQKQLPLMVPSIELQRKFKRTQGRLLIMNKSLMKAMQDNEKLFNSLLQRAFRGEL